MNRLASVLAVVSRRRWLLLAPVIACLGTAVVLTLLEPTRYQATAEILLRQRASESSFDPATGVRRDAARAIDTQVEVLTGRAVRVRVEQLLGAAPPVTAAAIPRTDVVVVSATFREPQAAADIANAYATSFIELRRNAAIDDLLAAATEAQNQLDAVNGQIAVLDQRVGEEGGGVERQALEDQRTELATALDTLQVSAAVRSGGAQLISPATAPSSPVRAQWFLVVVASVFLGSLLGALAAVVVEYFDDSITATSDLDVVAPNLGVLGTIPTVRPWTDRRDARVVSITEPGAPAAEAYRALRTTLRFLHLQQPAQVLQITSPNAGEGKTATVTNLGVAMAAAGQHVCVIDGDLRRPRTHEYFGVRSQPGFTTVVAGECSMATAVVAVPSAPGLHLLASGTPVPDPPRLLASDRTGAVFAELCRRFDVILVDSPPVLPVTDAAVLSWRADATIVVAAAGSTTRTQLRAALDALAQVDAPVTGVVLNRATEVSTYQTTPAAGGPMGQTGQPDPSTEPSPREEVSLP